MRKYTILLIVLFLHIAVRGQTIVKLSDIDLSGLPKPTTAKALRYWFDDDAATVQTSTLLHGSHAADVSGLTSGLHTLHYQVIDENDVAGYVESCLFLNTGGSFGTEGVKAQKLIYWFDDEANVKQINISVGTELIDASTLDEGLHTLHYQVLCSNRQMTPTASTLFLRVSVDETSVTAKSLRYWFDDEQMAVEVEIAEGVQLLDASKLVEGLHTVHYQIANSYGTLGAPASSVFLKIDANMASATAKSIRYWFDDDASTVKVTDVGNGTQTLDVAALSTGLHTLNYQLIDSNGRVSVPVTRFFLKNFDKVLADGYNRVTKYQYWLNRNSEAMQTVELDAAANPYTLIALLPMQKEPIQSSFFQFEVTNDVPTIYAKNVLHVRFHDAQGYFSDGEKEFVDYSVKQEVEDIDEIQETQTISSIGENQVKWYWFDALRGDSVTLRASKTCTIQIFTGKGEELLCSNGSVSVAFSGTHMPEMGTYYVAVHDVTAKNSNNLVLDYRKYDRYCVLEKKPDVIGNLELSYFVLSLKGNGFDKLRSASIVKDENVLMADSVQNFGYADAKLYFTLPAEKMDTGYYDLKLDYKDEGEEETLLVENAIQLVEAEAKNIELSFSEPSTNRSPFSISVHLKNKGNVGYTYLPINIAFDHIDDISDIQFSDFGVCVPEGADSLGYQFMAVTDNLAGKGVRGGMMFFFVPRIEAGEEYVMTFKVTASVSQFNVYAWMGKPIELDDAVKRMNVRGQRVNQAHQTACHILSFGEQVEEITGEFDNRRVNLLGQVTNTTVKAGVALAAVHNGLGNYVHEAQIKAYNLSDDDAEILRSMHPRVATPGEIIGGDFGQWVDRLMGVQRESADCDPNESDDPNNPDDPSNPNNSNDRNRHLVQTRVPVDPNDIIGYMAESSSKAIMNQLNDVYYTIQFENDPKLATASAHEIILADTLDATKFDLSTFAPTKVKIGEKCHCAGGRDV